MCAMLGEERDGFYYLIVTAFVYDGRSVEAF